MSGISLGVLSSEALAGAERSEGERSEPQRSGAAAKAGAGSRPVSAPDSEVVAKAKRRTYTAEYKQRILIEAEAASAIPGGVGALLRREGLYSSLLTYWKRERADGIREALTPRKRGPKSKHNPMEEEVQKMCIRDSPEGCFEASIVSCPCASPAGIKPGLSNTAKGISNFNRRKVPSQQKADE